MFLTDSQKSQTQVLLDIAFDTYKRPIYYYKAPEQIVLTSSSNYNYAYPDDQQNVQVTNIPESGQFDATIEYISFQDQQKLTLAVANTKFKQGRGIVRICVREDGRSIVNSAETINIDGHNHIIVTDEMPRGIFEPDYYDFWLQKSE